MRSRTNADASVEASPARPTNVSPNDSWRDRNTLVSVSLAMMVMAGVILSSSGGVLQNKGREYGFERCSYSKMSLERLKPMST